MNCVNANFSPAAWDPKNAPVLIRPAVVNGTNVGIDPLSGKTYGIGLIGLFVPGAVWGWKWMDNPFRLTCLFVTAGVVVSSAMFSWLSEVRNLVPAIVMLAIVNVTAVERYLQSGQASR